MLVPMKKVRLINKYLSIDLGFQFFPMLLHISPLVLRVANATFIERGLATPFLKGPTLYAFLMSWSLKSMFRSDRSEEIRALGFFAPCSFTPSIINRQRLRSSSSLIFFFFKFV